MSFAGNRVDRADPAIIRYRESAGSLGIVYETPDDVLPRAEVLSEIIANWLRSVLSVAEFRRGDGNNDGQVDLSDAVTTLGYLFLGSEPPVCLDAADANDSGELDVTDAIFTLGVLFLGQGSFPPPSPACGIDPVADGLDCREGCPRV